MPETSTSVRRHGDFYAINATTGAVMWTKSLTIADCSKAGIVSSATVAKDPVNGKLTVYVGAAGSLPLCTQRCNGRDDLAHADRERRRRLTTTGQAPLSQMAISTTGSPLTATRRATTNSCHSTNTPANKWASTTPPVARQLRGRRSTPPRQWRPTARCTSPLATTNGTPGTDATAIVKLASRTLARLGGYQIPGLYGANSDFNASPTLFTMGITPMVGACNKDGVFYALTQASLNSNQTSTAWQIRLGIPFVPKGFAFCGGSADYDGTHLFIGADAKSTGTPPGSMSELTTTGSVAVGEAAEHRPGGRNTESRWQWGAGSPDLQRHGRHERRLSDEQSQRVDPQDPLIRLSDLRPAGVC